MTRRECSIISFGVFFLLSQTVFAETLELVTYYPTTSNTDNVHANRLTVGPGYAAEAPNDGVALIETRLGIGTNDPREQLEITGNLRLPVTSAAGGVATGGVIFSGNRWFIHSFGTDNFFAGLSAGNLTMTGTQNTGIGNGALLNNADGSMNTALGFSALKTNTGGQNTAVGSNALQANTNGLDNTALGRDALSFNTTGLENTAVGSVALLRNTVGNSNTAVGIAALKVNTVSENTAVGYAALAANTVGIQNTALGFQALSSNNGVPDAFTNWGGSNTAVGHSALTASTTGHSNTAVGAGALKANITGVENTALGSQALLNNTNSYNTAVGTSAMKDNTSGSYNTATGYHALEKNNASSNTAVGHGALQVNVTGNGNTAVGYQALISNTAGTNTAIGSGALAMNTTGVNNVAIGYSAGVAIGVSPARGNTIGSQNIFIGYGASSGLNQGLTNATAIGYLATVSADNCLILGNGANVGIGISNPTLRLQLGTNSAGKPTSTAWTVVSDARLKENIKPFTDGVSVVQKINPVSYQLNGKAGTPKGEKGISVIAQEVKAVIPYTIKTYRAKLNPDDKEMTELYNFDSSALTFVLINAVKELKTENDALKGDLEVLKQKVAVLEKE